MAGPIILGYDGSDGAKAALAEAAALASGLGAPLIVAFGYEPTAAYAGNTGDLSDAIKEIGEGHLAEAAAAIAAIDPAIEVSTLAVDGRPAESLAELATLNDAHLIVVGHHGRGPLMGALLGSVTDKLLHQAGFPVLVVPTPKDE